jgi:hypothetical protein
VSYVFFLDWLEVQSPLLSPQQWQVYYFFLHSSQELPSAIGLCMFVSTHMTAQIIAVKTPSCMVLHFIFSVLFSESLNICFTILSGISIPVDRCCILVVK